MSPMADRDAFENTVHAMSFVPAESPPGVVGGTPRNEHRPELNGEW